MKRKVPIFKINSYNNDASDYSMLLEIPGLKTRLVEESLLAIKEAIDTNKKKAQLVEIGNSGYFIEINKDQFKSSLENALEYFLKKEDYNKCAECRDLIKRL